MYLYDQYVKNVLEGKILVSQLTMLTVKRYVEDLEKQGTKDFPYYFDKEKAEKVIRYTEKCIRHIDKENIGKPFILEPCQQFIDSQIYGWVNKDGNRRFIKSYNEVARKFGKSTWKASKYMYHMLYDGERAPQCYALANKYDQSKEKVFDKSVAMVEASPILSKKLTAYRKRLVVNDQQGTAFFQPVGSDLGTQDGADTHYFCYDEYHAAKGPELYNLYDNSTGSRKQPLKEIITTAGFDKTGPCYIEREYVINILNGTTRNDEYFGIIYTLDKDDDWTDEKNWYKSNPLLGVTSTVRDMKQQCQKAIDSPSFQNEFKTKRLNIWTQAENLWLNMEIFKKNRNPFREEELEDCICFGGVDLSWTTDITAFVMVFPPQRDFKRYRCLYRFYLPDFDLRRRSLKDRVPYDLWSEQGHITLTPGKSVDYDYVIADIKKALNKYNLKEIAYDPWNATQFIKQLSKDVDEERLVEYQQGKKNINSGTKEYERKVLEEMFATNGNPVIEWMAACTSVQSDADGNIKPVKPERSKTGKRIDGIVANIMAFDRAIRWEDNERSYYEDNDLEFIAI